MIANALLKTCNPTIRSAVNRAEYLKNKLKYDFPDIYENVLDIEYPEDFSRDNRKIRIKTKYGWATSYESNILRGHMPYVSFADNPLEYFKNILKDKQPEIYNNIEEFGNELTKYPNYRIKIKTKYGWFEVYTSNLMKGIMPTIRIVKDQEMFLIKKFKEIHGDEYDYSNLNFIDISSNVTIKCKVHGEFEQNPYVHLRGGGCPKCKRTGTFGRSRWVKMAKQSKEFKAFQLYKIKCFNDIEEFYKVGITFQKISTRFRKGSLPYNYEIIDIIESDDGNYIWDLEKSLHKKYASNQYIPKINFAGMYECFSEID